MALAIDASSPAAVVNNSGSVQTLVSASFTPPAGAILYVQFGSNDSAGNPAPSPGITDSVGLTWTLINHITATDAPFGTIGQAAHWWARVGSSTAMTVTVTNNAETNFRASAMKVNVVTGAVASGSPIGASGENAVETSSTVSQNYTATEDDSMGFLAVADWDVTGNMTAGTGETLIATGSPGPSHMSYGFFRTTNADAVSGNTVTLNATLGASSNELMWVYAEIVPETTPPTWDYKRQITIDHACVDADLTNFPVLVRLTSADTGFFTHAQSNGQDVRFRAADETTELTFERERHDDANDLAEYWVKVPTVSGSTNTIIWLYYGSATAADAADTTGAVWDADFIGVYHLNQAPSSLTHVGTSAVVNGTTSVTPAMPAGYTATAGDLDLVTVISGGTGPPTVAAPTGYTEISNGTGGAGTQGAGAGPRRVTIFRRDLVGGEGTPAFTISGTGAVLSASRTILRKSGGGSYTTTMSTGADGVDDTAFSATMGATLPFLPGDMVYAAIGTNDNTSASAQTLTATGTTFANLTERSDGGSTNGNDASIKTYTADVTAGLSTAAAVLGATLSGTSSGVGAVVRVRVTGDITDSSGTGNHGASQATAAGALEAAKIGQGLHLDGSNDFISLPSFGSLADVTVEVWFNRDASVAHMGLVSRRNFQVGSVHLKDNAGTLTAQSAGNTAITDASTTITNGTWYSVAYTFDQSGSLILWRDGVSRATGNAGSTAWDGTEIEIGHEFTSYATGARFLDGLVDEVRISDVIRSDAWLEASYCSGNGTLLTVGAESATSGQTIALGQVAETDTARALTRLKTRAVGRVTETDTSRTITPQRLVALGRVTETDAARGVTVLKTVTLTRVSETDTSRALSRPQLVTLSQVAETDTSRTLTGAKTEDLGRVAETDAARAITSVKTQALGRVSETDTARALTWNPVTRLVSRVAESDTSRAVAALKVAVLARVSETDTSRAVEVDPLRRLVTAASETDAARTLTPAHVLAVARVAETDTSRTLVRPKTAVVTQVAETDAARSLAVAPLRRLVARVAETDAAGALTAVRFVSVGRVTESDTARAVAQLKTITVGRVIESDVARTLESPSVGVIARVTESDTARTLTPLRTYVLGAATDVQTARTFTSVKTLTLSRVSETDAARAHVALRTAQLTRVSETDTSRGMSVVRVGAFTRVEESNVARSVTSAKTKTVGRVSETDTSRGVAWVPLTRTLGRVAETDAARTTIVAGRIDRVGETDTARAVTSFKTLALTRVAETDTARGVTRVKSRSVGRVSESDTSRAITVKTVRLVARTIESDVATAVGPVRTYGLTRAVETDLSRPLGRIRTYAVGGTLEVDTARLMASTKLAPLGRVAELDAAQGVNSLTALTLIRIRRAGREPTTTVAGRRPTSTVSGREPNTRLTGREEGSP